MQAITFNQLQLRILIFLIFLFAASVFSYRYFVERPRLMESFIQLSDKEFKSLTFSIQSKLNALYSINFDYAVWTSTYEFINAPFNDYIEDNFVENTFVSLEIDGVFYFDEEYQIVYQKGLHHTKLVPLNYSFYDFQKYPDNQLIFPEPITENGAPTRSGFIATQHGPALYSVTQIRDSNMDGEHRGFLMMLQLLENKFVDDLSQTSLAKITFSPLSPSALSPSVSSWNKPPDLLVPLPYSDLILNHGEQIVSVLRIEYSVGESPAFINLKTLLFVVLLSIFVYIVFLIFSLIVIEPIKQLAADIKGCGGLQDHQPINDSYLVDELSSVAKNVNTLMLQVQSQNKMLSKMAHTDQLTSVLNRRGLISELTRLKEACVRHHVGFSLVMIDLDHFKAYNDSVGHLQGDSALVEIANLLHKQCQPNRDACGRFGGEEFVLLFSDMSHSDLTIKLTTTLQAMQTLNIVHPDSPTASYVTLSMGAVSVLAEDVNNQHFAIGDIFEVADKALYQAKDAGRNQFVIRQFSSSISHNQSERS